MWFGEVHDGRPTPSESPGAAGRFVDGVGTAPSMGTQLARMSGSFVGIRLNRSTSEFDLFNDVLGTIPLYLRRVGGRLLFAPESKALLEPGMLISEGMVAPWPSISAWGISRPDERTFGRFAVSLPLLSSGSCRRESWSPPTSRSTGLRLLRSCRGSRARSLYGANRGASRGDREFAGALGERIGICLSGGHDSRGVLAAIRPRVRTLKA